MAYEVVIGLEAHAQLLTASKMFCGCSTAFGAAPNTQTGPVFLGLPRGLRDLNRAGTPLLEIVTEPDMRSPDEAVAYLKKLRDILVYLEVCDGNMEEGSLRCEPNLSLRPAGSKEFGTKVELKNINSFKFAKAAMEYDADVLTSAKELAKYFEDTVKAQAEATALSGKDLGKETSNWVMVELLGLLHKGRPKADGGTEPWTIEQDPYEQSPVRPQGLAELLVMKRKGEISGPIAKSVLEEMFNTGKTAAEIIKAKGLTQMSDEGALEEIIDEVMAKNPQQLAQYRSGKEQLFGFFVGQVMKASGGKANPTKVNELLKRKLAG